MENVLNKIDKIATKEVWLKCYAQSLLQKKGKGARKDGKRRGHLLFPEVSKHSRKLKSS